jgi:hypothetical protein
MTILDRKVAAIPNIGRRGLRPKQVASKYNVCLATVWNRIKDGQLKSKRAGRCRIVDEESADEYFLGETGAA